MKLKKLLSAIISIVMIASCIVVPVSANQAIYTEANGWTLPTNSEGAIAAELSDGRLELNNEALFTPKLEENKKYSIKFNVTGLEKGDDWTYQFRLALISGGETLDGALSYRQAGIWENGKEQKWLANGTDGEVEVIFDTGSGVYKMYALGAFSASGIFADASDFTLKFYKWGGNAPYISNVRVEELAQNSIYNSANGWALPASSEDVSAIETADGKLQMNHEVRFTPELKENKKYVECNSGTLCSPKTTEKFRMQYAEFLRELFEMGIPVTYGSDSHKEYIDKHTETEKYLSAAGFKSGEFAEIKEEDFWF